MTIIRSQQDFDTLCSVISSGLIYRSNIIEISVEQHTLIKQRISITDTLKRELKWKEHSNGKLTLCPHMICLSTGAHFKENTLEIFGEYSIHFVDTPSFYKLGSKVYYPEDIEGFKTYLHSINNKNEEEIYQKLSQIQQFTHEYEEEFRITKPLKAKSNSLIFKPEDVEKFVVSTEQESNKLKDFLKKEWGSDKHINISFPEELDDLPEDLFSS